MAEHHATKTVGGRDRPNTHQCDETADSYLTIAEETHPQVEEEVEERRVWVSPNAFEYVLERVERVRPG